MMYDVRIARVYGDNFGTYIITERIEKGKVHYSYLNKEGIYWLEYPTFCQRFNLVKNFL